MSRGTLELPGSAMRGAMHYKKASALTRYASGAATPGPWAMSVVVNLESFRSAGRNQSVTFILYCYGASALRICRHI